MLLALAEQHGIEEQVAALLENKPPLPKEQLGELLRQTRLSRGELCEEVHQRCNISRSQLGFYELGKYPKRPGLRTLQAISYGYRIPFYRVLLAALNSAP